MAVAPTPCRLKPEPCRPHSLPFGPRALLHLGNNIQLWLWIEQALGFASEFPEEPLSTTEVFLTPLLTPWSLKSPALLEATCCNPAGGRALCLHSWCQAPVLAQLRFWVHSLLLIVSTDRAQPQEGRGVA